MQCVKNVENDQETSSVSNICAKIEKDNETEINVKTNQLMCSENDVSVKTDRREAIKMLKAEHEAIIRDLQMEHEAEVRNLHMYYESRICELQMNHGMMVNTIQRNHETLVCHLRNLNYSQGIRQEAALRSMRELKDKMVKDHQEELQDLQLKYSIMQKEHGNTTTDLIEGNKLLCTEHEKVVRDFKELTKLLTLDISTTMYSFRTEHEAMIKVLRKQFSYPLEISKSSDLTIQNRIEVEGLKLAEEKQQRTIITAHLQTTNGHEDNVAETTTSTIGDDHAIVKSQDTMPQKAVEDCKKIFYDTVKNLRLLHKYVYSNTSNCLIQADDLQ